MPKYEVTIRATVTRTFLVTARDEENAQDKAHERFILTDNDARYDQDTLSIKEVV